MSSTLALGPLVKIEIEHTHADEHADVDNHHDELPHDTHSETQQGSQQGSHHCHEILVGGQLLFMSIGLFSNYAQSFDADIMYNLVDLWPPKSPDIFGIFRPPIS